MNRQIHLQYLQNYRMPVKVKKQDHLQKSEVYGSLRNFLADKHPKCERMRARYRKGRIVMRRNV